MEVAVIVALQHAKSDIVGVHHEEMEVFEDTFVNWSEPLLREVDYARRSALRRISTEHLCRSLRHLEADIPLPSLHVGKHRLRQPEELRCLDLGDTMTLAEGFEGESCHYECLPLPLLQFLQE